MTLKRISALALLLTVCLFPLPLRPQAPSEAPAAAKGTMMLTIFLRHDESKTLDEIDKNFPPPGVEIVSWYVMMGIGQVVTLRFPAERLRDVNLVIEHGAWGGAYRTEFYPTYDYKPIWEGAHPGRK